MLLTEIHGFDKTWVSLANIAGRPNGQYSGLASGAGVQEIFEGNTAKAIHIDITNVQVLGRGQIAGELRNVITTLQTGGNQRVDVHFFENGQISTIPHGSTQVIGAALPARIAKWLPNPTTPSTPTSPAGAEVAGSPGSLAAAHSPTYPEPSRFARAAAWTAETAPKVLRVIGQVVTIVGAANEIDKTDQLLREHNEGLWIRGAHFLSVGAGSVLAGVADDALAVQQTAVMGAPVLTVNSWERNGSGPVQHSFGELYRGYLNWAYE